MRKLVLTLFISCAASPVFSQPVSLGAGVGWQHSSYKEYTNHLYPIPYINYDNGVWYLENTQLGAYLYNENRQNITLSIGYLADEFRAKDSRDPKLATLSNRHSTAIAILEYNIDTSVGSFALDLDQDILNESQSILIDFNYTAPIPLSRWLLAPQLGIRWANARHNNYYYGISHQEARVSGLQYYYARSSVTPYVSINMQYQLNKHLSLGGGLGMEYFTNRVTNSPMVSHRLVPALYTNVIYQF